MNNWTCALFAALGGVIGSMAAIAAMAEPLQINDSAVVWQPVATVYTCENVPPFHPEEWGEIRQLRQNCQAAQEALLLVQIWEQDPMAGVVLE